MHLHRRFLVSLSALLLGLASFGSPPTACAAPEDEPPQLERRPMLWVIEGDRPVFLFGTFHLPDARVLDLPGVVRKAFDGADVFNAEIPMETEALLAAQPLMMLPADQSLDQLVPEDLYQRTIALVEPLGIPAMVANRMKVWVLGLNLFMKAMSPEPDPTEEAPAPGETLPAEEPPPQALDAWLYNTAKEAGKEVGGLETVAEQIGVFDALDLEAQIEILAGAVEILEAEEDEAEDGPNEAEDQLEQLLTLYLTGDVDGLGTALRDFGELGGEGVQAFFKRLFDDRNVRMVDRLIERMEASPDKVFFVAVGAGHFAGPVSIRALLEEKGYTLRRLEIGDEVPMPTEAVAPGR